MHPSSCSGVLLIAVRWEFHGKPDDFAVAQAAVEKVLHRSHRRLGGIRCTVHGAAPVLVVAGRKPGDLDVRLETCCSAFQDVANARIHNRRRGLRGRALRPAERRRSGYRDRDSYREALGLC
jgi:hypothetical protein